VDPDVVLGGGGVGRGMDVLDGWLSSKGKGQIWGLTWGIPL